MAKGKAKNKVKKAGTARKPRIPAVIQAYSGSGFHIPAKYGTSERAEPPGAR